MIFITLTTLFTGYIEKNGFKMSFLSISTGFLSILTGLFSFDLIKKAYGNISEYLNSNKEKFMKQLKYPSYNEFLGTRENVRRDLMVFKDLIMKQIDSENSCESLVIMVDELDRCSEKTIINFFSSIEAFVDIPGITFVFSINPEIVYPVVAEVLPRSTFNEKENSLSKTKLGAIFIEKYINLFVTIPTSSSYDAYIQKILEGVINEEDINKIILLLDNISNDKKTTPREIKKLLDIIMIYNSEFLDITISEFSALLIMKYYYKDFMDLFEGIDKRSMALFKETSDIGRKVKTESSISEGVIHCVKDLLEESNMYSVSNSIPKIERILLFT